MTTNVLEKEELGQSEEQDCRHYWLLEAPSGAKSQGVCKHCGRVREFSNSGQDHVWQEERSADLSFRATSVGGLTQEAAEVA